MSANEGMQDFTMSLKDLVEKDFVDRQVALDVAPNVEALKMALKGIDVKSAGIL
jgi:twitching motility protein PilT